MTTVLGAHPSTLKFLEENLALHREPGDERGVVWALNGMGGVVDVLGDHERAVALLEEAWAITTVPTIPEVASRSSSLIPVDDSLTTTDPNIGEHPR